ncbi:MULTISPECIES: hypothetical protein [Halorussus]|uniref:hypothetical protein n=1 Tax=Halorussus TaxID=1070314 RepID=UPI0020A1650B|nr:hypothetical protein [Halorussus vallis]USZ78728.1 hypothetical protein NGM07_24770 [Halorussus vallis]
MSSEPTEHGVVQELRDAPIDIAVVLGKGDDVALKIGDIATATTRSEAQILADEIDSKLNRKERGFGADEMVRIDRSSEGIVYVSPDERGTLIGAFYNSRGVFQRKKHVSDDQFDTMLEMADARDVLAFDAEKFNEVSA